MPISVPKFALESTTESLPTFQSPNKGKLEETEKKPPSSPYKYDDSHVREMMKGKYGHICPVCTDKLPSKVKYQGVFCCRSCSRFFRSRACEIAEGGDTLVCQNKGR